MTVFPTYAHFVHGSFRYTFTSLQAFPLMSLLGFAVAGNNGKDALSEHGAHALPVAAEVVVRVGPAGKEVEVAGVARIRLVERRRPIVAVLATAEERSAIAPACGGQENGTTVGMAGEVATSWPTTSGTSILTSFIQP